MYAGTSQESSDVTTPANLFSWMKSLPYHNCLNLSVLEKLASFCDIMYLHELLKEYQQTFFTTKLFDLFPSREFRQIHVKTAEVFFVIESHESNNILKKDVTINDLDGFLIEYTNQILTLNTGVVKPHAFILESTGMKDQLEVCIIA